MGPVIAANADYLVLEQVQLGEQAHGHRHHQADPDHVQPGNTIIYKLLDLDYFKQNTDRECHFG